MHAGDQRRSAFGAEKKNTRTNGENGQSGKGKGNTMLIYEYKVDATPAQKAAIEEAIRIVQFVRNKALHLWMDTRGTNRNDLQCLCAILAKGFAFAAQLNSQARQAAASRAWFAIEQFYSNCQQKKQGRKGVPASSTITARWNTSRRAGNWTPTAGT